MESALTRGGPIEYEPHALDRMDEFGVTGEYVRATLEQPDEIRPPPSPPTPYDQ